MDAAVEICTASTELHPLQHVEILQIAGFKMYTHLQARYEVAYTRGNIEKYVGREHGEEEIVVGYVFGRIKHVPLFNS